MPSLTPRETEVIELVADGKSNKEIARSLGIRLDTVKHHVSAIMLKLEAANRAAAVAKWAPPAAPTPPRKWGWTNRMNAA